MIITGSHNFRNVKFEYYTEPIIIENDVWIAARGVILNGTVLKNGCIISAGSVVPPHTNCEEMTVYSGVPATKVKKYNRNSGFDLDNWMVYLR